MATPTASPAQAPHPSVQRAAPKSKAWQGWIVFAGIMLMVVGTFQAVEGFVAIFSRGFYAVNNNGLVVHFDYTAWGWIMLAVATGNVLAGFGVVAVKTWARIWAIGFACLSIITNIGFTSAYPVWAAMMVALAVIVIYALCVHWDDMPKHF
jgi:hypothetical protein